MDNANTPSVSTAQDWSETRFQTHFEQTPLALHIFSPLGQMLRANRAALELWNMSEESANEAIRKGYNMFDDPQLHKMGVIPYLKRAIAGEAVTPPNHYYDPVESGTPGRARWLLTHIYPIKDQRGEVREVVVAHDDITDKMEALKAAEHAALENAQLYEKASVALQSRDEFLSIASHELKTPLAALQMAVQILARTAKRGKDLLSDDQAMELLDSCTVQSQQLGRLIDELLDLARARAGKLEIRREQIDLVQTAREALARLTSQTVYQNAEVSVHAPVSVEGLWDRQRITQIVTNLLSNAFKYGKGSPVQLRIEATADVALIIVQDQGLGIKADECELIFRRFERGSSPASISGLGLGLYIARKIVDAHQGVIRVESKLGAGSIFSVELPRHL